MVLLQVLGDKWECWARNTSVTMPTAQRSTFASSLSSGLVAWSQAQGFPFDRFLERPLFDCYLKYLAPSLDSNLLAFSLPLTSFLEKWRAILSAQWWLGYFVSVVGNQSEPARSSSTRSSSMSSFSKPLVLHGTHIHEFSRSSTSGRWSYRLLSLLGGIASGLRG